MNCNPIAYPENIQPVEVPAPTLTPEAVKIFVARYFGKKPEDLHKKQKTEDICRPRRYSMYFIKEIFGLTDAEIGKLFLRDRKPMDHTTVEHNIKVVKKDASIYAADAKALKELSHFLKTF